MRKVMVFGTFDGLHEGHRAFLREARDHGDYLVAVVTPDHAVKSLKGREPRLDIHRRMEELRHEDVDEVILGDADLNTWEVIDSRKPDVIALGYDQTDLKNVLEEHLERQRRRPEIVVLSAYKADKYHSSLLAQKAGDVRII